MNHCLKTAILAIVALLINYNRASSQNIITPSGNCILTVRTIAADSLFIDGDFVGTAPCRISMPKGCYKLTASNGDNKYETEALLLEENKEIALFLPPKTNFAPEASEEQIRIIQKILNELTGIRSSHTPVPQSEAKWLTKHTTTQITYAQTTQNQTFIEPFMVQRYPLSLEEWEIIGGNDIKYTYFLDNDKNWKKHTPIAGLSQEDINDFLKKLNYLSGIKFSIPEAIQLYVIYPNGNELAMYESDTCLIADVRKHALHYRAYAGPTKNSVYFSGIGSYEWVRSGDIIYCKHIPQVRSNHIYPIKDNNYAQTISSFRLVLDFPEPHTLYLNDNIIMYNPSNKKETLFNETLAKAEQGDAEALRLVGNMYHSGYGTTANHTLSFRYILEAAQKGNVMALYNLAFAYRYGVGTERNSHMATSIYKALHNKGEYLATANLAECYLDGTGVIQSAETARKYAQQSIDAGEGYGHYVMGKIILTWDISMCEEKEKKTKLLYKAFDHLKNAAQSKVAKSYYYIGNCLTQLAKLTYTDMFITEDPYNFFTNAADMYALGYMFQEPLAMEEYADILSKNTPYTYKIGADKAKDIAYAVQYKYIQNPMSQFSPVTKRGMAWQLYRDYNEGRNVKRNRTIADFWLKTAANYGEIHALNELGKHCLKEKQYDSAINYFIEAGSHISLARLFYYGADGFEADKEAAFYWLSQEYNTEQLNRDFDSYIRNRKSSDKLRIMLEDYGKTYNLIEQKKLSDSQKLNKYSHPDITGMLTSNTDSIATLYGKNSLEYAIARFCELIEKPSYRTSIYRELQNCTDIILNSNRLNSGAKANMSEMMGEVYFQMAFKYLKDAYSNKYKDMEGPFGNILELTNMTHAALANRPDDYQEFKTGFQNSFTEYLPAAKRCFENAGNIYCSLYGKNSSKYIVSAINHLYVQHLIELPEPNTDYAKQLGTIREVTDLIQNEIFQNDEDAAKKAWEEYKSFFLTIIPNMAFNVDEGFGNETYNSAIIYKTYKNTGAGKNTIIPSWKDISAKLKNDEAAIEFVRTYDMAAEKVKYLAAIVTATSKNPIIVNLPSEQTIQECIDKELVYTSTAIYEVIWKPVQKYLTGVKKIYFAPDGLLHNIAIESVPCSGEQFVDQTWEIYRLSSTALLTKKRTPENISNALLVAGANYGNIKGYSRTCVGDLPHTVTEAENISSILKKNGIQTNLLTADKCSESNIRNNIPHYSILHFATHGYWWSSTDAALMPQLKWLDKTTNNPLERSGLLFNNANSTMQDSVSISQQNDGILSAHEISHINLSKAQLVVLSACNTARGNITYQGVEGLQSAILKSGAKSVMLTLWSIDDLATSLFMTEFYKNLSLGKSSAQSLRTAREYLRNYTSDDFNIKGISLNPYANSKYWAPFIMINAID